MSGKPEEPIEPAAGGIRLHLLIQPRASISEVVGLHDGRIKIRLAAAPVEGAANGALLKFLTKSLGVPLSDLEIASGTNSRRKAVTVKGISVGQASARLGIR